MKRIKKNDEVIVLTGGAKIKGKTGTVSKVDGDRVIVSGVNMVTKHIKADPNNNISGGRVKKEASIHISNLMLVEDGKGVKTGFRFEDGKKVRFSKKTNTSI